MKAKKLFPDLSFKRMWDKITKVEEKIPKLIYSRFSMINNLTLTGAEDILHFKKYFSRDSNMFQINDDGTITYIGEKTALLNIEFSAYFYTGTLNKLFNLKIYSDDIVVGGSQNIFTGNYSTLSSTTLIKVEHNSVLKFTCKGTSGDVISSNNFLSKVLISGWLV